MNKKENIEDMKNQLKEMGVELPKEAPIVEDKIDQAIKENRQGFLYYKKQGFSDEEATNLILQ